MTSPYHGIIFTGSDSFAMRSIGAYRIRTICQANGYRIKVIDFSQNLTKELITKLLKKFVGDQTVMLGVSSTFLGKDTLNKVILEEETLAFARSRSPKIQVVIGGPLSDIYQSEEKVDWIIRGYADVSVVKLLDFLTEKTNTMSYVRKDNIKVVESNSEYKFEDTSNLSTEWLDEDYIQPYEPLPIEIARGCIFKCSFCAYPLNGKKKFDYIRAKENFTEEIDRNFEKFGTKHYLFMDDTFNDSDFKLNLIHDAIKSAKTPITFCGYIKPELLVSWPHHAELLVSMGLEGASLGVESFNPMTRSSIGKGMGIEKIMNAISELRRISNYSIGTQANMIVGAPWESKDSISKALEWYRENTDIISNVQWTAMNIMKPSEKTYSSAIDQDPTKYGYTITRVNDDGICLWKNKHMNVYEAVKFKDYLIAESKTFSKLGGWQPGMLRTFKNLDVSELLRNNVFKKDIKVDRTERIQFLKSYFRYQVEQA